MEILEKSNKCYNKSNDLYRTTLLNLACNINWEK